MDELARTFKLEGEGLPLDAQAFSWEATEALSEPYAITVRIATADGAFGPAAVLRRRLCLAVWGGLGLPRLFDGVVDRVRFAGMAEDVFTFEIRLVPSLAALAHREACRLFQEKSVVQIAQSIFDDAGFGDAVEWRTTKTYGPRELTVQWQESHLHFVSRLFEEVGLFYFFDHTSDGHRLVVADDPSAFGLPEGAEPVLLAETMGAGAALGFPGGHPVKDLRRTRRLRTTLVQLRDYDFEKPQVPPSASTQAADAWTSNHFDYPGGFVKAADGQLLAEARLRSLRRDADVVTASSQAVHLRVGVPFAVAGAGEAALNGDYVVTRLVSRGEARQGGDGNVVLENRLEAIPKDAWWSPPRRHPKPRIRGVQTAIVTGSSQQEQTIHTEAYGRIKVRFFWDRQSQQDHTSSPWIRVAQVGMGGTMVLPRVGWEVSVAFLDGDPDRPLVLGRVYNAEKTPPYALPASKASGSMKSMSSPGGGGHNEIKMADDGGSQGFSVHAQKDLNVVVGHDKIEEVGVDEASHVSKNASSTVEVDETISVSGDQKVDIGAVLSNQVGGDQTVTVGGNDVTNAISNHVEKVGAARSYSVGGNQITIQNGVQLTAQGSISRDVGALHMVGSVGSISEKIVGDLDENVGVVKAQVALGSVGEKVTGSKSLTSTAAELHLTKADLTQEAGGSVTHLVGGLHYQKLAGDLSIKAPMVALLGAVGVFKGGASQLKLGGAPITLKGSKVSVTSALVVKMSGSMKLGS